MNPKEIQETLSCFHGTTSYYKHQIMAGFSINITDGCNYLRINCKCFWLFDIILSYQGKLKEIEFQVWKLKKIKENEFRISCEDGNDNEILFQDIPYSDFPLNEITIWLTNGIALLPSEY